MSKKKKPSVKRKPNNTIPPQNRDISEDGVNPAVKPSPALKPEDFSDNEITEAGLLITRFFEGILAETPVGTHRLEAKSSSYSEPAVIVYHRDTENNINVEKGLDESLTKLSATILQGGNFSATLHSFINEDINDSAGLMRNESLQEIRAWAVSRGDIYALNAKQIVDAYCRDFATGKLIDIPENIAYLPAWKITS